MKSMFESATLKLTGWYILILMAISILFSILVYQISFGEVRTQLERYEKGIQGAPRAVVPRTFDFQQLHDKQLNEAQGSLILALVYINVILLITGGLGSYLLARRTLKPIEESHETQSRFVSDASHELRTPLAAMTTELEVALRDPSLTKAEMKELLDSNLEEVRKLTTLTQTLLQLSIGKQHELPMTSFSLDEITRERIEKYDQSGSRVSFVSTVGKVTVNAHQASIEELITILLDNALKYSPENSPIAIKLFSKSGRATFSITNTGKGIDPVSLPHIFDRFYRADTSRSGDGGHGLGLSLAKQISELHKAELSVTSTQNKTTEFRFSLPIIKEVSIRSKNKQPATKA